MILPKHKPTRLKGKKLHALYDQVYMDCDGFCKCGQWIEPGTPPHHKRHKSLGGGDTYDNLEMLCGKCHANKHF